MADTAAAHALTLLETMPLLDGHNDLPIVVERLAGGDLARFDPARVHPETDTDIPRLQAGRVSAQVFAAFIPVGQIEPGAFATKQIALIRRLEADHPGVFRPGRRSEDIGLAKREGRIASIIAVENGSGLENQVGTLETWYRQGVRLLTLCHNETLGWVDSATDVARHGGLTELGRDVVREMNRLGMIVDCSHVAPHAAHAVMDIARVPLVLSHSNVARLCDHPRNAPDDVLDRVAALGGLVMACFIPRFTSQALRSWHERRDAAGAAAPGDGRASALAAYDREHGPAPLATLPQVCDHIEALVARIGVGHVGIGSDFHGGAMVHGLDDVSRFPDLVAELVRRGWSDADIALVAGGNFVRVMAAVEAGAG